jgi:hypothetical protein
MLKWRSLEFGVSNQRIARSNVGPINVIVQDALRAAVHAASEAEGLDLLADALRKVSDLASNAAESGRA